jgi:hypothetical protein
MEGHVVNPHPYRTILGHRLACAERAHQQAMLASAWNWFRIGLCVVAIPVSLFWLYTCAYL